MNQDFNGSDLQTGCGNEPDCECADCGYKDNIHDSDCGCQECVHEEASKPPQPQIMTLQQKYDKVMTNLENTLGMFVQLTHMLPPEGQTAVINQTVQVLRLAFPAVPIQMPAPAKGVSRIVLP